MVLMITRVAVDAAKLEELSRRDPNPFQAIRNRALEVGGVKRHRVFATENEVLVVDEWDHPEDYQQFVAEAPELQQVLAELGLTAPPEVTFARQLDLGDDIG